MLRSFHSLHGASLRRAAPCKGVIRNKIENQKLNFAVMKIDFEGVKNALEAGANPDGEHI